MPVQVSYPGVYVVEVPSSVHPIAGVSTSSTAFVDVFRRGPVATPVRVDSMGEFERAFGGVWSPSEASYGISQYFLNGGQTAWIVRVVPDGAKPATSPTLAGGSIGIAAKSPGAWGNALQVGYQDEGGGTFGLAVREVGAVHGVDTILRTEVYHHLTSGPGPRNYAAVLETQSDLVRAATAAELATTTPKPDGKSTKSDDGDGKSAAKADAGADADVEESDAAPKNDAKTAAKAGTAATAKAATTTSTMSASLLRASAVSDLTNSGFHQLSGGDDGLGQTAQSALNAIALALPGDDGIGTGIYALRRMAPQTYNVLCLPATAPMLATVAADSTSTDGNGDTKKADATGKSRDKDAEDGDKDSKDAATAARRAAAPDLHELANAIQAAAAAQCALDRAFYIVDGALDATADSFETAQASLVGLGPNTAIYYPPLVVADSQNAGRARTVGPSGTLAGIYARTDNTRGVWKAPAGTEATIRGAAPAAVLTDAVNGQLNELGINVLRTFPVYGSVSWGARTLTGADNSSSQWKYVNVRRLALFIESSLVAGTKWAVFEPNDERLWGQLRLNVGTFMHDLFRQGAFAGTSSKDAYFVRCDRTTTSVDDAELGIVNILVGFAPAKPAEFVVISIQQIAAS